MKYRDKNNEWQDLYLEPAGDTLPIGSITQYAGSIAPTNWLICDGSEVSRTTYKNLFNAIGTTYGEGDGSTTFNLPDFSSRSPMGVGTGTDGTNSETTTLGQEKGEYKHTLKENEMPEHFHKIGGEGALLYGGNRAYFSSAGSIQTWANNDAHSHTSTKGGSQAHNTIHPVLGVNFIIKAKQSVGLVGSVTSDINDTNENAVPNAKTVKDYVNFKLLNKVTGKVSIQLPANYNEIIIVSTYHQGSYDQTFSTHLTKNDITNKQYIYSGFYYNAAEYATCNWYVNNNMIQLNTMNINGENFHTVCETKLYIK